MHKLTAYAFVAALLAAGLSVPGIAMAGCGAEHVVQTVDRITPEEVQAEIASQQTAQPEQAAAPAK
ncbi:MAG TPA: hypothetical protein VGA19_11285 [Rhodospirillales bacterium]